MRAGRLEIMQQDRPVNGSSRELVYTGGEKASTVEFTGAVRLWQGDKAETVIQGDKITVDSKSGNLDAQGSVLSTMIVQDTNPTTKVPDSEVYGPGAAHGLRRRDAEDHLYHEGTRGRAPGRSHR